MQDEQSLEEIKQEAKDLGVYSPGAKMFATVLEAPTNFKKGILYILPLYLILIVSAPDGGFRGAASIFALGYLFSILLLPYVKFKKSKLFQFFTIILAIIFIFSLACTSAMFFALLVISVSHALGFLGLDESLSPFIVAILCYLVMKIYQKNKKRVSHERSRSKES